MLKGSDNIITFYTKRYGNNPLVIQGAGYVLFLGRMPKTPLID
jgi:hypothetical protein